MVRRYSSLVCLLAVAGIVTYCVATMLSPRQLHPRLDSVAIARHFAVILDDASTVEEADRSVAYFRSQPTEYKTEFAARAFAKSLPEDLGWIEYRELRGSSEIPKPYRRTCQLWRVMNEYYRGGSPGLALQKLAPQPDFVETTWKLVRHLPNVPEDVAHFKGSLLHGLMAERRLKLVQMELGIPVKNVPPENPEIIRLTGQLIYETPTESMESAYFLALQFGEYIGVDFKPDSKRPEYQGPNRLNKQFFSEPAKQAAKWWQNR